MIKRNNHFLIILCVLYFTFIEPTTRILLLALDERPISILENFIWEIQRLIYDRDYYYEVSSHVPKLKFMLLNFVSASNIFRLFDFIFF